MGAYYTKEDITEYISKNTILPFLFDQACKNCRVAFEGEHTVWHLPQDDPEAYIYDAVKHSVDLPLPESIAQGLSAVSQRQFWNQPAPAEYGLPTEIWREVVARRQRCEEIRAKLAAGQVRSIHDFITYNLNVRVFALDVLKTWDGADLIRAFWDAIRAITILDPTCGSGAFLFAALEILKPLYEECLNRMGGFVADADQLGRPHEHQAFRDTLKEVAKHPNRDYFVFKSIIINNLYGVDIMEEATEICKLRLFLKLAAQVEPDPKKENFGIEPLPDIDFNIRAGNTLVGFATEAQTEKAVTGRLDYENVWPTIQSKAAAIAKLFEDFQKSQNDLDAAAGYMAGMKAGLRKRLTGLRDELDKYLGQQYGKIGKESLAEWKKLAQPFHWFIEFYTVMKAGGFDVIVGNPPWVEYRTITKDYRVQDLKTIECSNLWAFVTERSLEIMRYEGRCGLIVPMSLTCTERMLSIQKIVRETGTSWLSNYESDSNPGQLFDGVKQNVSILLSVATKQRHQYTTRLSRFFSDARNQVFYNIEYVRADNEYMDFGFPKASNSIEHRILQRLFDNPPLSAQLSPRGSSKIYVHRIAHYYIKCFDFVPYFCSERDGIKKSEDYKEYNFKLPTDVSVALINSTLFYYYWQVFFDSFKAGKKCVESFPCAKIQDVNINSALQEAARHLTDDMKRNSRRLKAKYGTTGSVEYDQFYPRQSKPIIDQIDRVLAKHYGFTDEETDFIINYDIKYRMGRGGDEAEEGA